MAITSWVVLGLLLGYCVGLPVHQKPINKEPVSDEISGNDTAHISRRIPRAVDFAACELDISNAAEPYDEDCPDGASGLLPCNPGQLKVKECITNSDNLLRICDPCPQKFYQSRYNHCTQCHLCSECGPNERIREDCTDETDTVCENIIPDPDPVPTTTPPPRAQTSRSATPTRREVLPQTTPDFFTTISSPLPTATQPAAPATEIDTTKTEPLVPLPQPSSRTDSGMIAAFVVFTVIPWILCVVLFWRCVLLKKKYKRLLSRSNQNMEMSQTCTEAQDGGRSSSSRTSPEEVQQDSRVEHAPVVHAPDDESLGEERRTSRGFLDTNVTRDGDGRGDEGGDEPNNGFEGDQNPDESEGLERQEGDGAPGDEGVETTLQQQQQSCEVRAEVYVPAEKIPASSDAVLDDAEDQRPAYHPPEKVPVSCNAVPDCEGDQRPTYQPHEKIPASSSPVVPDAADEHNPCVGSLEGIQEDGHKATLEGNLPATVQRDYCPPEKLPAADKSSSRHTEQLLHLNNNLMNRSIPSSENSLSQVFPSGGVTKSDDLSKPANGSSQRAACQRTAPRHKGRVQNKPPGSHAAPGPRGARKIPNGQRLPTVRENENNVVPSTGQTKLGSKAPMASEEDISGDILEKSPTREADAMLPVQENEHSEERQQRPGNDRTYFSMLPFNFFSKKRKKYDIVSTDSGQVEDFLARFQDEMVCDKFLDCVAYAISLKTLDKLCRELGAAQNDIDNYREEYKDIRGNEHAFKVLMKVRGTQGQRFTYGRTLRALQNSNKSDLVKTVIEKYKREEESPRIL